MTKIHNNKGLLNDETPITGFIQEAIDYNKPYKNIVPLPYTEPTPWIQPSPSYITTTWPSPVEPKISKDLQDKKEFLLDILTELHHLPFCEYNQNIASLLGKGLEDILSEVVGVEEPKEYTETDLVDFGNFLLDKHNVVDLVVGADKESIDAVPSKVKDNDLANWKDK